MGNENSASDFLVNFSSVIYSCPIEVHLLFAKYSYDFIYFLLFHSSKQIQRQTQQFILQYIDKAHNENVNSTVCLNLLNVISKFSENIETIFQFADAETFIFIVIIKSFATKQESYQVLLNNYDTLFSLFFKIVSYKNSTKKFVTNYFDFLLDVYFNEKTKISLDIKAINSFLEKIQLLIGKPEFNKISLEKILTLFINLSKQFSKLVVSSPCFSILLPYFILSKRCYTKVKKFIDLYINFQELEELIELISKTLLTPLILEYSISSCTQLILYSFDKSPKVFTFFLIHNPIPDLLRVICQHSAADIFTFIIQFNKFAKKSKASHPDLFEKVQLFWKTQMKTEIFTHLFHVESKYFWRFISSVQKFEESISELLYSILKSNSPPLTFPGLDKEPPHNKPKITIDLNGEDE